MASPRSSVTIEFVANYIPKLSSNEVPLKLLVYTSTTGKPRTELCTHPGAEVCLRGKIVIEAPLNHPLDKPYIPHDTVVVFANFVGVPTKENPHAHAVNQVGTCTMLFRDLLVMKTQFTTGEPLKMTVKNALAVQNEWDGVKATIQPQFEPCVIVGCQDPLMPEDEYCLDADNYSLPIRVLKNLQKCDEEVYNNYDPTFSSMKGFIMPEDQFDEYPVPGSVFQDFEVEPSDEEFYRRIAMASLFRCFPEKSEEEALEYCLSKHCSKVELKDVLETMFTIYPNFCTYLPDATTGLVGGREVEINYEYFSNHLRSGQAKLKLKSGKTIFYCPCGDCEDLQAEQGRESIDFKGREFEHPLLKKLVKIRSKRMYAMTVMGVRGEQLSDGRKAESQQDPYASQGGHAAGSAFREKTAVKLIALTNEAKPIFPTIRAGKQQRMPFNQTSDTMRLLEGTGPAQVREMDAKKYELTLEAARHLFQHCVPMVELFRPLGFNNCKTLNDFYRSVHRLDIPDLARDGYRNNSFILMDLTHNPPTIGVTYQQYMNPNGDYALWAQPERSDEEVMVINRLMQRFPFIQKHQVPEGPETCDVRGPIYDKMEEIVELVGEKRIQLSENGVPVLLIVSFDVLQHEDYLNWLKRTLLNSERVAKFESREVALDTACGGYNLKVWVNPE